MSNNGNKFREAFDASQAIAKRFDAASTKRRARDYRAFLAEAPDIVLDHIRSNIRSQLPSEVKCYVRSAKNHAKNRCIFVGFVRHKQASFMNFMRKPISEMYWKVEFRTGSSISIGWYVNNKEFSGSVFDDRHFLSSSKGVWEHENLQALTQALDDQVVHWLKTFRF